jgi:transposase
MTFTVEQKVKNRIYLYEVTSYWDKEKKQSRQKRKYLGPKDGKIRGAVVQKPKDLITKSAGTVSLLRSVSEKIGLTKILKEIFPDSFNEILGLSFYDIMSSSASYLYPHWHDENHFPEGRRITSGRISELHNNLGILEKDRFSFAKKWSKHLSPKSGLYYDITSLSSYATDIDFVEWGYNRDKERLPQINMGITYCGKNELPVSYNIHPGNIVDVSTLSNNIKSLNMLELKDILFILDRGFFSKKNILELESNNIKFLQPLSFSTKKTKDLLKKNKDKLSHISSCFKYNQELFHYCKDEIEFDKMKFDVHIFHSEKIALDQKESFLSSLLTIEQNLSKKIPTSKAQEELDAIIEKYKAYFTYNKKSSRIEKNITAINDHIATFGSFLISTNKKDLTKEEVLSNYRQRDSVEKIFNNLKNEIDGNRLRIHSNQALEGKLFIKFVTLILHSKLSQIMRKKDLYKKYSMQDVLQEFKKIRINRFDDKNIFLSELSKKQKELMKCFEIEEGRFHD